MLNLSFHGAAGTVTGSKYRLAHGDVSAMIDCGQFQGLRELRDRNWQPLPFDVSKLSSVVLTHAHIDHVGYLPRLVKQGFRGPIYCTPATVELTNITLLDAAHCQEEEADYANRKGYSKHKPALPLFDEHDVRKTLKLLTAHDRKEWFGFGGPFFARFHDAGHLLGSASIEVEVRDRDTPTRLLFSGDVGRYTAPLYHDPQPPAACDYLICESTYGDRDHPVEATLDQVADTVNAAYARGGAIVVAAFAIGRAQQLIYLLRTLKKANRIPDVPIYLDSPMAVDATNIYCAFADEHDLSESELTGPQCVLRGRDVHLCRTAQESKALNGIQGPAVIISSSGMMTGGRILHHLKQRLPDPKNTIVLGGYAAPGTRARQLADGTKFMRLLGHDVPVRAAIARMPALSGHADRTELLRWLAPLADPKRVFLTHGEPASARALAGTLRETRGWNVEIPKHGELVELE
ncbi:MAG: MBL fold metallo-hydrolase [Pirellulales bacterium]